MFAARTTLLLAGTLLLAPMLAAAPTKEKVRLAVGSRRGNIVYLQIDLARALGYFEQEGLDVDIQYFDGGTDAFQALKAIANAEFERKYVTALLESHAGNVTQIAHAAQKDRRSIQRLIEKHGISTEEFSPKPSAT